MAVMAAFACRAQAQDAPHVTVSGFGTAALTRTNTDGGEFSRVDQASGAGKDARTGVDSNFGIQANARFSDAWSFTAQGLARKSGERDQYGADLNWAFVKYKINDDVSARLGRIGMPIYMLSDSVNIGYASTMLRPPTEMYRQVPLDYADGGDLLYQHSFGETTATAQFAYGSARNTTAGPTSANANVMAAQLQLEQGPFTYRVAYSRARISLHSADITAMLDALRQVGFGAVADQLNPIDNRGTFASAGFTMDYHDVLAQAEYGKRKVDTALAPDTSAWYVMLGYRWGKWVPFYVHGNVKQDSPRAVAALPTNGPLAPLSAVVNGAVKSPLQSTDSVGVRWDFYKSAAFKLQVDRVKPRDGVGYFLNTKPGFSGPVTVYAAAIDFVF
ncbi:hypothetical protein H3H37_23790 [Duganella sp. LX20W]|uniref:Porin n=1 Tax=Rugamonas brunnea TaxID=2758569 RepID=A0A7W2EWU5_9BURK|nr:hypothetical protein [Rugamonas brunnea]MBA5640089.1 hypothetical protein [Rugamonas brunnea]